MSYKGYTIKYEGTARGWCVYFGQLLVDSELDCEDSAKRSVDDIA